MNQNSLFKISLIVALAGTLLLIFLSNNLEPKSISIEEINRGMLDNFVKINGNISGLNVIENMFIMDVEDKSRSIIVIGYGNMGFEKGMIVEVIGKVIEYEGELEIEATKIK